MEKATLCTPITADTTIGVTSFTTSSLICIGLGIINLRKEKKSRVDAEKPP
ncbi:MAG: hypothetical protein ACW98F_08485 [Candidatus Hodarchaeales archaeon]|jgi:hypothetical protein